MPDQLDAMLLRLRAQHSEPAPRTWKSPIEARLVDDDDDERDDDEPHTRTIENGCADGAGGTEWNGSGNSSGFKPAHVAPERDASASGRTTPSDADCAPLNERRPLGASVDDPLAGLASVAAAQGRPPEVDPYSPDPALYSPEWMAEFDRRCAEAVAEMTAAIERARNGR